MKLYIVGFGAGNYEGMTIAAKMAIDISNVIVGYTVYVDLLKQYFPQKLFMTTPMRRERERVLTALEKASQDNIVSLVCSGDSGVYGMASLALELSENYPNVEIEIVPGVTAALSGGAALGSPLTNDFAVISLSDLLTSWEKIEKRLEGAAIGDFAIAIYNPASKKRRDHLSKACEILLKYRDRSTICGYVRNIGRNGQESGILTLGEMRNIEADMFTTVFIGNSETRIIGGKMITPRGYNNV